MTAEMTLMIVDDSLTTRYLMRTYLQDIRPELHVVEAESAEDARIKLAAEAVDFILVDYKMPGDDGITFIEKLKADPVNQQKMALLTANIQDELGEKAKGLDVPFFHKPPTVDTARKILDYFFDG